MAKEESARLRSVVNWLIFSRVAKSQKGIAQLMGYNHCVLSQVLNDKAPVTEKFVRTLSGLNERINAEWVLTGEGEMLKEPEAKEQIEELPKTLSLSALTNLAEKKLSTENVVLAIYEIINEKINEITQLRSENDQLRSENEQLRKGIISAGMSSTFYS